MPRVQYVEETISSIEGFDVAFLHANGRNVHGAMEDMPQYEYQRAAPDSMTLNNWKNTRFKQKYPGYDVAVYDGEGQEVVAGQTQLGTIRNSY